MHFTPAEETHILTRASLHDLQGLDRVKAQYQEPHRHYHDWNHALAVLSWVNHCCDVYQWPWHTHQELGLAALFHDVVYTTQGSPKNEEDSVAFLQATLGQHEKVGKIILATAQHGKLEAQDVPFETALFMDCDIASFGEPRWEIAVWNDQNITLELLQKFTPEQIKVGRKAFLGGLLAKQSIFLTPYFQDRFETQARRNIRRLIAEL
jgi:predicted metal-dependent HD superfamily phosphohydrolase